MSQGSRRERVQLRLARRLLLLGRSGSSFFLVLAGCSGDPVPESIEAETQQAFGEATCRTTTPDFGCVLGGPTARTCEVISPETYSIPDCTNAFIGEYLFGSTGTFLRATGPSFTGSFPCNAAWVRAIFWRRNANGSWTQLNDSTQYGSGSPATGCSAPVVNASAAIGAGKYRVAAQAGVIYSYKPVTIAGRGL